MEKEKDDKDMKIGIVFAGQGAQYPGMGKDLYDHDENARAVFEEAGPEVMEWCFDGDKETLRKTHITQPCVYTTTMAAYAALQSALQREGLLGEDPGQEGSLFVMGISGFSLGEYAALTAAGCITDLAKGLEVVTLRGQYMEEAGLDEEGRPRGGMVAAFGDTPKIEEAVREAAGGRILEAVNYNNPRQTVVAGETAALADFLEAARERHLKTKKLSVSTAFHCAMMRPAAERLRPVLASVGFRLPRFPLYSNITAESIMEGYTGAADDDAAVNDFLAEVMARQVMSPVYFENVVRHMLRDGAEAIVEVGPGHTLSGFTRKISHDIPALNVEDMETLAQAVEALKA